MSHKTMLNSIARQLAHVMLDDMSTAERNIATTLALGGIGKITNDNQEKVYRSPDLQA